MRGHGLRSHLSFPSGGGDKGNSPTAGPAVRGCRLASGSAARARRGGATRTLPRARENGRMRFVDLSAPIRHDPEDVPEPLRTEIEFADHAPARRTSRRFSASRPSCCVTARAGRSRHSCASGPITRPTSTRRGTTTRHIARRAREDDRRVAAGVVPRAGRRARLHRQGRRRRGDRSGASRRSWTRIGHELAPLDIVLIRTGRDAVYGSSSTWARARASRPRRRAGCSTAACG